MARPKSLVFVPLILWFLLTESLYESKPLKECMANERAALLSFKEGLEDPFNRLSTWRGEDCCGWSGVTCNNKTGHVVRLDLSNTKLDEYGYPDFEHVLIGKLNNSLLALRHLNYLDLSLNSFYDSQIPEFFGSMNNLRYLNLSGLLFGGRIPPQIGNLSRLQYLDLNNEYSNRDHMYSDDLSWLPRLSLLKHLDISWVNISKVSNWVEIIAKSASIKHLYISESYPQKPIISPLLANFSNLLTLDISWNNFADTTSVNWVWNLTSLEYLDLSGNNFKGIIPGLFNNLCHIKALALSSNTINMDITEFIHGLPRCLPSKQITSLKLAKTNLVGNLSSVLEQMAGLQTLDLNYNNLTGPIPYFIGATKLSYLDLSTNSLHGMVYKDHFTNFSDLRTLFLDGNSLVVHENWVPPFALRLVGLDSCKLGPKFPSWIKRLTNIVKLRISRTNIVDNLPDWFLNFSSHLVYLDLSHNQIKGDIHKVTQISSLIELYLHDNQFEGTITQPPQNLTTLDLSYNSLSGSLPSNFGNSSLVNLILQKNSLSGTIPASICQLNFLQILDLSSNLLVGPLPECWRDPPNNTSTNSVLVVLILSNNFLSDIFPSFLKYYSKLFFLDLSYNQFYGNLPSWVGEELSSLWFLVLRSNKFSGNISVQITKLNGLQVLDLAHNNFSGTLPPLISAFIGMTQIHDPLGSPLVILTSSFGDYETCADSLDLVTKGQTYEYNGLVIYMTSIDLSSNGLTGEIPEGISSLSGLKSLNLSGNHFSGNIPEKIGAMQALESLDLSDNYISGEIPFSLSEITSLSYLNLSYNNLSGRIPSGNQLQTLDDPSIYIGNNDLCGPPLSQKCPGGEIPISQSDAEVRDDGSNTMSLYLGSFVGFFFGLWLVFCLFLFKRKYLLAYFQVIDNLYDRIHVFVVLSWSKVL